MACAGGGAEPVAAEEVRQSESAGACLPTISAQEDVFVVYIVSKGVPCMLYT